MENVYNKNDEFIELLDKSDKSKIIYEGNLSVPFEKLENSGFVNAKYLVLTFIYEGNWYFSHVMQKGLNGAIIIVPKLNYDIYVMSYYNYIEILNPNKHDLSKIKLMEIMAIY